jgi:hypothetical protein
MEVESKTIAKFIANREIEREVLVEILIGLWVATGGSQVPINEVNS